MEYSLRSIAKGSILYALGQTFTKAFAFFLIPVYTRFLSPVEYGIVGYLLFVLQLFFTVLMFGFYGAQNRFFYEHKNNFNFIAKFLFSINVWLLSILIPFAIIFSLYGNYLYEIFGPDDVPFYPYFPLIVWTSIFQVMNQLVISYWIAKKNYLKTTLLQILQFSLITGFTIVYVVILHSGAIGYFKGILYGQALFFIISYPSYCRIFICKFSWHAIYYASSFGFPIVIHLLAGTIHTSFDRAILAKMVPLSDLGYYTLGYQFGMVMYLISTSVNNAWQPSYYELMESSVENKSNYMSNTYNIWLLCMSYFCVIGILWGGDILLLLTPEKYNRAAEVIPFVIIGYFFHSLYLFVVAPIFFYKKTIMLFIFTGSSALINIFLNYLFIPYFSIVGAAVATSISMLFQFTLVHFFSSKFAKCGVNWIATIIISILLLFSIFVTLSPYRLYFYHWFKIGIILLMLLTTYILFKKDLQKKFSFNN